MQEEYVSTFDRGRSHCLHLFEHIHGESRDRGQAMVNLSDAYEEKGFFIDQAELPDYIPCFSSSSLCARSDEAVALAGRTDRYHGNDCDPPAKAGFILCRVV